MISVAPVIYRRAAWLICSLALLLLAVACEIENDLPPRVAVAPTSTPSATETPEQAASEPTAITTPAPEPTSEPTPQPEPTATSTPDILTLKPSGYTAPEPTPAPYETATPTPASCDQDGPIDAPAPAGSTVVTADCVALTITGFNPDASDVLISRDSRDKGLRTPIVPDGNRLLIARVRVQNVGGNADDPIGMEIILDRFYLIAASQAPLGYMADTVGYMGCREAIVPDNLAEFHEAAALFPGGTLEGNVCFTVPESETDIVLMHDARDGYDNQTFLALANPNSVEPARVVDARREPLPGQVAGRSRFNPIPPGMHVESADGLMALALASADLDADFFDFFDNAEEVPDGLYNRLLAGYRLVTGRVRVQNIGGDVNTALILEGGWDFAIVGSSSIEFYPIGCGANGGWFNPTLFPGGIAEVDVCFAVPESETDLVLNHASSEVRNDHYELRHSGEEPRRWLAFANPNSVEAARVVDAPLEPSPDQLAGRFRSAPVPFGESAHTPDGIAVSIVSADLDAEDEFLSENPTSDPPAEGMRFVSARARIEWVGGNASDMGYVRNELFGMVGSSAVVFSALDNSCGAIVPDELAYIQLSGGETVAIDVCFELPQSETDLTLFFGRPNDESTRWLRMPES